jgi:hypothetical protein
MEQNYKYTEKLTKNVITEILKVERTVGLTAESLLEQAKNPKSSLHELFDWDNKEAGVKWRLQQARVLINEVKIIVGEKVKYAFENVSVVISNNNEEIESERLYKPIFEVLSNEDYRKQKLESAKRSILYWRNMYADLEELKPLIVSIDNITKTWQNKQ